MRYKSTRIAYIYKIVNPIDDLPFYVGVTKNPKSRFAAHFSHPITLTGKMLKENGIRPIFIAIEICKVKDAQKRETFWISEYSENIENRQKASCYSTKSGRKPLKDKKIEMRFYFPSSWIEALGGDEGITRKMYDFIEREVNQFKI